MEITFDEKDEVFCLKHGGKQYLYNDYTNRCGINIDQVKIKERSEIMPKDRYYLKVIPSNACNLNCTYCFSHDDRMLNEKLQFEKVKETVRKIVNDEWNIISVSFTGGGEPTTNFECIKDFVEFLVDYKNVHFNLTTNGFFNETCLNYLIDNHINVAMSIDGTYEIQNSQQVNGLSRENYQKVIQNAKKLVEAGNEITILTVLSKDTIKKYIGKENKLIEETLEYYHGMGIMAMSITFDKNMFFEYMEKDVIESIVTICMEIVKWKSQHKNVIVPNRFVYSRNHAYSEYGVCQGLNNLRQNITILPNGNYSFCHKVQGDEYSGTDYSLSGIEQIKKNRHTDELKEKLVAQKKKCKNCIARQTCMGSVCPVMFMENSHRTIENYCKNNYDIRTRILQKAIFE